MNPLVQLLQALAGGAAAAGGGAPAGLLAGGARAGVPTPTPRPDAPAGLLGGAAPASQTIGNGAGVGSLLGGLISKERGGDLMAMGAQMMQAGAPSTNPASGDFISALGSGLGAASANQGQRADTDLKRAVTQAQIGNYQSAADQNRAQTGILQSQAAAMSEGMPQYGNPAAANAAPAAPGQAIQPNAPAAPAAPEAAAGPTAGQVYDGFRFKGGNPNDPAAWEKV